MTGRLGRPLGVPIGLAAEAARCMADDIVVVLPYTSVRNLLVY